MTKEEIQEVIELKQQEMPFDVTSFRLAGRNRDYANAAKGTA